MNAPASQSPRRILIVDDNPSIHEDFRKILSGSAERNGELEENKAFLFGDLAPVGPADTYLIDSAYQGEEGYALVRRSAELRTFYAMAFVDLRMPPGWDGVETILRMWEICPELEVVICTAYSDYSWEFIHRALGRSENLLVLMKPCDKIEVLQIADSFTRRWTAEQQTQVRLAELESIIQRQHHELQEAHRHLARLTASMQGTLLDNVKLALGAEMTGFSQFKSPPAAHDQLALSVRQVLHNVEILSRSMLNPDQQAQAQALLKNGRELLTLVEATSPSDRPNPFEP